MPFSRRPAKLEDCLTAGPGSRAELFLVEGDSASSAVSQLRDQRYQAVLPMQGKPMNAIRAGRKKVLSNPLFMALIDAIGTLPEPEFQRKLLRYESILLLFDPDADGIHCGALMAMFFYRWMPDLISAGRIRFVRPPVARIEKGNPASSLYPLSEEEFQQICHREKTIPNRYFRVHHYRGLAGIDGRILKKFCIDPRTRVVSTMTPEDARAAMETFGSGGF